MELMRRNPRRRLPQGAVGFAALALMGVLSITAVASPSSATTSVYVRSDDAVVRESPSAAARPLAHPLRGEELLSFGRRGDWVNVLIHQGGESKNGWILHSEVSGSPPAQATPPDTPE